MQKGRTILVIDDEATVLKSIAGCLESRGWRVIQAENGRKGLDLFKRNQPDLVLTDLLMHEIDGLTVLWRIHEIDPDQPIIVVSGTGRITDVVDALRLGAWDYIVKPIENMSIVLHAVDRAFERSDLLAQNRAYQENLEALVKKRTAALEQANSHLSTINTRLKKVVATTRGISLYDDIGKFGATLLSQFAKHMLATGGSLFLLESDGLHLLYTLDPTHVPCFIPFPLQEKSVLGRVLQSRRPLLVTDITKEKNLRCSGWEQYPNGSALAFPLMDENSQIMGVITLHSKTPPPFIEQDKEIGAILASYSFETLRAARTMESLRESEARFRELAEMLPEAVFETDLNMILTFANQKAAEIFGYSRKDLSSGFNAMDMFIPQDRRRATDHQPRPMDDHAAGAGSVRYTGLRRDGSTFPMLFHMAPIKKDNKTVGYRAVVVDITDEMILRDHLRQAQKMEAVGQLAGGIAHDLNNMLSPILGFSEMLLEDLDENDEHRKSVDEIIRAGMHARDLIRKLLAFSRKQTLSVRPVNINTVLKEFENLLRRTIREDIEIDIIAAPRLPACMADVGQIEQVIINLAINAADAMPDGGKLTITTGVERLDPAHPHMEPEMQPGSYVMLTISDTGHGMDEATCRQIFEPFFSTKGIRGTGLGLSTVYGIVKQHEGSIRVDSHPGSGSRFTIYLPVCSQTKVMKTISPPAGDNLKGTGAILLVEDDAQVRKMTHTMLDRLGYTVIVAKNGDAAMSALDTHGDRIDLMLTDVVLQGMNGRELYARAAKAYPKLKVLYMSGYSDDIIAHHRVLEQGMNFIEKPFLARDLAKKISQVLRPEEA